jgi:hypothetical protein
LVFATGEAAVFGAAVPATLFGAAEVWAATGSVIIAATKPKNVALREDICL